MEDPLVMDLAKKYGKTPAQILLRHLVQLGFIVIPKSVNKVKFMGCNMFCRGLLFAGAYQPEL